MNQRVGVFGGTFDPIHVGHLAAAVNTRDALDLDVVLLVVAHVPWQKVGSRDITPSDVRLRMVEAAVANVGSLEASAIEIERGGDSYTADTLAEVHRQYPGAEVFLVIGTDAVGGLETWSRPDEVRDLATLAVVERPGSVGQEPPAGWNSVRVPAPYVDLSSTQLRAHLRAGRSLQFLVPDAARAIWETWWLERRELDV